MLAGVTIERPETVTIDAHVRDRQRTPSSNLSPACWARPRSARIAAIGAGGHPRDRLYWRHGPWWRLITFGRRRIVDPGAQVGPFARLRMQAQVGPEARVGNFVELKKTTSRRRRQEPAPGVPGRFRNRRGREYRARVPSPAITMEKKHRTKIGERAFIGSNSTLVAPVQVGDSAYIAAGSVITDPVPDETGLGRSRQVLKEGWVAKRREKQKQSK